MTPAELKQLVAHAAPGEIIKYFYGNLAWSRGQHLAKKDDGGEYQLTQAATMADALGAAAWSDYEAGRGVLVQQRTGAGVNYLFILRAMAAKKNAAENTGSRRRDLFMTFTSAREGNPARRSATSRTTVVQLSELRDGHQGKGGRAWRG